MENRPPYEPTPEQIAAGCLEVQSRWSDTTRDSRARPEWRTRPAEPVPVKLCRKTRWLVDYYTQGRTG